MAEINVIVGDRIVTEVVEVFDPNDVTNDKVASEKMIVDLSTEINGLIDAAVNGD